MDSAETEVLSVLVVMSWALRATDTNKKNDKK
jgi:hypothetical protein